MTAHLKHAPVNYPKPNLGRLSSRVLKVRLVSRKALETELRRWIAEIVHATGQDHGRGHGSGNREVERLLAGAQRDIDVLMNMPTTMKLGKGAEDETVHADFGWSRAPGGRWIVGAISFAPTASAARIQVARQRELKERLLAEAEARNERSPNLQKMVFKPQGREATWHSDSKTGASLIATAIEVAHGKASSEAKMLENPVKAHDVALDLMGGYIGAYGPKGGPPKLQGVEYATKAATRVDRMGTVYKVVDNGKNIVEEAQIVTADGKSTGDQALETALNFSSYVPVLGPFIKGFAGMLIDVAIASDASRVTKLRSRAYIWFVAGYIAKLTWADTGTPGTPFDKRYFELGQATAPPVDSPGNYKTQLYLMDYASSHYTDGGWGGLGYRAEHWTFPDQYVVKWSPELLARSLATQLHTRRYLLN